MERPISESTQNSRKRLHGLKNDETSVWSHRPEPALSVGPAPRGEPVETVERGLNEQHPQMGIGGEELPYEELVSAPYVIPDFERAHHDRMPKCRIRRTVHSDGERSLGELPENSTQAGLVQLPPLSGAWNSRPHR